MLNNLNLSITLMKKLILSFCLVSAATSLSAATLVINPVVDTFIRESVPNDNFSGEQSILVGHTASSADEFNGLLKFSFTDASLVGATINSVTLTMYKRANGSSVSADTTIQIFETIPNWDSTQTTWNISSTGNNWNTPGAEGAGFDYVDTQLASFTGNESVTPVNSALTFTSDVAFTTLVQNNIGNTLGFLAIVPDSLDRTVWNLGSVDNANPGIRPILTIDFTPIPEPSSVMLGLGALVGLGMLRKRKVVVS